MTSLKAGKMVKTLEYHTLTATRSQETAFPTVEH